MPTVLPETAESAEKREETLTHPSQGSSPVTSVDPSPSPRSPNSAATAAGVSTGVTDDSSQSSAAPEVSAETVNQVTSAEAAELALTTPQQLAMISLRTSPSRMKAAAAAQVTRQTLWNWMRKDPAFQAAYNAWQQDLIDTARGELLAGTREAVQTVLRAARKDPRYAWRLLECQGVTQLPQAGSTDVQTVADQQADERRIEAVKRKRLKAKLDMAESQADLLSVPLGRQAG
jgi:hypothetical protein